MTNFISGEKTAKNNITQEKQCLYTWIVFFTDSKREKNNGLGRKRQGNSI